MKKISRNNTHSILVFMLFSFPLFTSGQAVSLPFDQTGKVAFYEVIPVDTLSRDTLFYRARRWMYYNFDEKDDEILLDDYQSGKLKAKTSLLVYTATYVVSKIPHGVINYTVAIDVRDKKYRYHFTDFVFQYYEQKRSDYKYKPVVGRTKPLEDPTMFGFQKSWDSHRKVLKQRVETQIRSLKRYMLENPAVKLAELYKPAPVIKKDDW